MIITEMFNRDTGEQVTKSVMTRQLAMIDNWLNVGC